MRAYCIFNITIRNVASFGQVEKKSRGLLIIIKFDLKNNFRKLIRLVVAKLTIDRSRSKYHHHHHHHKTLPETHMLSRIGA